MKTEYVIFGKPPGESEERLLVSESAGIETKEQAEKIAENLRIQHGCTETRVHAFRWDKPNFTQAIQA